MGGRRTRRWGVGIGVAAGATAAAIGMSSATAYADSGSISDTLDQVNELFSNADNFAGVVPTSSNPVDDFVLVSQVLFLFEQDVTQRLVLTDISDKLPQTDPVVLPAAQELLAADQSWITTWSDFATAGENQWAQDLMSLGLADLTVQHAAGNVWNVSIDALLGSNLATDAGADLAATAAPGAAGVGVDLLP